MNLNEHSELNVDSSHQNILQIPFLELANSTIPLENLYNMTDYNEPYDIFQGLNFNNQTYTNQQISFNNYSLLQQLTTDYPNDFHNITHTSSFHLYEDLLPNSLFLSSQHPSFLKYNNNLCLYNNTSPSLISTNKVYETEQSNFQENNEKTDLTMTAKQKVRKIKNNTSLMEKTFECSHCESRFARKDEIRRHEKIHSGVRTLSCPYCDKKFIRSDHRRTHIRTHTGEKPYTCEICDKCFARSDERTRHIKIHFKDGYKHHMNIVKGNNYLESKIKEYTKEQNDKVNSDSPVCL